MTTGSQIAYVQQSGEGELRFMGETSAYFLADGERTGGKFALVDERAGEVDAPDVLVQGQDAVVLDQDHVRLLAGLQAAAYRC